MEREPHAARPGLIEAVARDYPNAPRIKLNLPGEWTWVERIEAGAPLYVAALPPRREARHRITFGD